MERADGSDHLLDTNLQFHNPHARCRRSPKIHQRHVKEAIDLDVGSWIIATRLQTNGR